VSGNREVDEAGVAVAVRDGDDWNAQLARLRNGDLLLCRVDDEQSTGNGAHALDAADVLLEASALFLELRDFLLGNVLVGPVLGHALERLQTLQATLDRAEVGERTTQPTVDNVVLTCAGCFLANDLLRLALRAYEHQVPTTS